MLIYQVIIPDVNFSCHPKPSPADPAGEHDGDGGKHGGVDVQGDPDDLEPDPDDPDDPGDPDDRAAQVDAGRAGADAKSSTESCLGAHGEYRHCFCWFWGCSYQGAEVKKRQTSIFIIHINMFHSQP